MARTTDLTPEVQRKITAALKAGNYFNVACQHAGINPGTGHKWMAWGEGRDYGPNHALPKTKAKQVLYREFREAVTRAEADAEVHAVAVLRSAMPEDWRAAAEYLRRRNVDRWGRERVDVHVAMKEYGETMAEAFRAVLAHPDLGLTAKQRRAVPSIIASVLPRFTDPDGGHS